MNKNKNDNFNQINQILLYSQNYCAHKKMLTQAKSRIDDSSIQRNVQNQKLLYQHHRYNKAVQKLKDQQLNISNKKISSRLINILKQPKTKQKIVEENKKSTTSRSFFNLKTAKQRSRQKYNKYLDEQNKKLQERISTSRSKQNFGRQSYYKIKKQSSKDLNVMSEFSQRSQSVLENLVHNNLKLNNKDIPFLPQLSSKARPINRQKLKELKSKFPSNKLSKSKFHKGNISFQKQLNFKL